MSNCEEMQPALSDGSFVDSLECKCVEGDLRAMMFDPGGNLELSKMVGLEIDHPDLPREDDGEVDDPLDNEIFRIRQSEVKSHPDPVQVGSRESRGEGRKRGHRGSTDFRRA